MQAFIVRPFGLKQGIDFDAVERLLIHAALEKVGVTGRSTGAITEAGNIRDDMFQLLLLADLVVADISIQNANVFYELGIRHSLRTRQTFLLRAWASTPEARAAAGEVPFDLKTDRYMEYDAADPAASVDALFRALRETVAANRVDSPVFRSLPSLKEPAPATLNPVPLAFVNDVDLAAREGQGGKLGLFGSETRRMLWQMDGLRLVGRRQFAGRFLILARRTWETLKGVYPLDLEANLLLGTIYQRLGELVLSDQSLERVLDHADASVNERTEALTLRARNSKVAGRKLLVGKTPEEAVAVALRSGEFRAARDSYAQAFQENLNHFYSGLNALSMGVLVLSLIEQQPDTWCELFDTEEESARQQRLLQEETTRLGVATGLSIEAASRRAESRDDPWVDVARADYTFLTAQKDSVAAAAYGRVLTRIPSFSISSVRDQLDLFSAMGVRCARVAACLERFLHVPDALALRQTIVFTGHMIDAPDRESPRFPPEAEGKARAMIEAELKRLLSLSPGPALGIAGGASGGDILFHEVCAELGVPTRVLLTLPEHLFLEHSVTPAGGDWSDRFSALLGSHSEPNQVQVLAARAALPEWMRNPQDYDIWQRTNVWLLEEAAAAGTACMTLVALWDQKAGLTGGTQDFIEMARDRDVAVSVLDARALVG